MPSFQTEIGTLIGQVKNDSVYKGLMKKIITDHFSMINKHCVFSLLILYLPISECYWIIRAVIRIYKVIH